MPVILWCHATRAALAAMVLSLLGPVAFAAEQDAAPAHVPLEVRTVSFSPDGLALAVTMGVPDGRGEAQVWELPARTLRFRREEETGVATVAWSPDGALLAIGVYAGDARLIAAADGRVLTELRGHNNAVRAVAFSPSGEWLATAGWDNTARVWNAATREVLHVLTHGDRVNAVAFSADGELLATASNDSTGRLWHVATGEQRHSFQHGGLIVRSLAFTPDGRRLATACWDGSARLWDVESGERWMNIRPTELGGVDWLRINADGSLLAAAGVAGRKVALFRLPTSAPDDAQEARIAALMVLLDHDDFATRQQADDELAAFGMAAEPALSEAVHSPSAEVRIRARRLRERATSPAAERTFTPGEASVTCLDFAPDGALLAVGLQDGRVLLFDPHSGDERGALPE